MVFHVFTKWLYNCYHNVILDFTPFSKFTHIVVCINTSFILLLNNVPVYAHKTIYLSINKLMDSGLLLLFAYYDNVVIYVHIEILYRHFRFSWAYIYRSRIAGLHGNSPCLTFGGTAKLLFNAAPPFYIPTCNIRGF